MKNKEEILKEIDRIKPQLSEICEIVHFLEKNGGIDEGAPVFQSKIEYETYINTLKWVLNED